MRSKMLISIDQVKRLKEHDEGAYNDVYHTYYRLIYFLAFEIVKDSYLAEDIVQDAFVKLMGNIHLLNNDKNFHQYLITIVKNLAFNEIKRKRDIPSENIEQVVESKDKDQSLFEDMHDYLTKQENQVVIYKIIYECTIHQIAKITNISPSSTYRTYLSALKKIKQHYKESL